MLFEKFTSAYEAVFTALKTSIESFVVWIHGFNLTLPEAIFCVGLMYVLSGPITMFLRMIINVLDSAAEAIMKGVGYAVPAVYQWVIKKAARMLYPERLMAVWYFVGLVLFLNYMHKMRSGDIIWGTGYFVLAFVVFSVGEIFRRVANEKGWGISDMIPWRGARYGYAAAVFLLFSSANRALQGQFVPALALLSCGCLALGLARMYHTHKVEEHRRQP